MITGTLIFLILLVGGAIFVAWALRAEVFETERKSERLHDPGTATVEYVLPNGVDPANVEAPLALAGFESVVDDSGGARRLLIGCAAGQRERLRDVIRDLHLTNYDGSAFRRGLVVFNDEGDAGDRRATA